MFQKKQKASKTIAETSPGELIWTTLAPSGGFGGVLLRPIPQPTHPPILNIAVFIVPCQ